MSDNKKRILIVDDDLATKVETEFLFKNAGVEVEVFIARWMDDGMEKLKEWAAEGHPADLVNIDLYVPSGDLPNYHYSRSHGNAEGISFTRYVMDWAEQQPEA